MFLRWERWFRSVRSRSAARRFRPRHFDFSPLEDRTLLAAFVVNSPLDSVDATPGDGLASDASGNTTLRSAIQEANALAGADTITLGAGTFTLSIAGNEFGTFAAAGDLDVNSVIVIEGAGAGVTILNAAQIDRLFEVFPNATLTLQNLTVTGGSATTGGAINTGGTLSIQSCEFVGNQSQTFGGAIAQLSSNVVPSLAISNSVFKSNSVIGPGLTAAPMGGAIYLGYGTASLAQVTFEDNSSAGDGGAIAAAIQMAGTGGPLLSITDSTFIENTASLSGGALSLTQSSRIDITNTNFLRNEAVVRGGSISSFGPTLNITGGRFEGSKTTGAAGAGGAISSRAGQSTTRNVEFVGNTATDGGALYVFSSSVTLIASVLEGNTATGNGGAVAVASNGVFTSTNNTYFNNTALYGGAVHARSTTRLINSTISGNTSSSQNTATAAVDAVGWYTILTNSLIAGNTGNQDYSGGIESVGGNLFGALPPGAGIRTTDVAGTPQAPINPLLGPLAANGGPVRTMPLLNLSPARDIGLGGSAAPPTDARGFGRSGLKPDAGAYEFQNTVPVARPYLTTINENEVLNGQLIGFDADGDPLTFLAGGVTAGTLIAQPDGSFVYTPPTNFNGIVRFSMRVDDKHGGVSAFVTCEIQVLNVDSPPQVFSGEYTIDENSRAGTTIGPIQFSDDGPGFPYQVTIIAGNDNQQARIQNGWLIVEKPEFFDFETSPTHQFTVQVRDGQGRVGTGVYTVHLNDVVVPNATGYFFVFENVSAGTTVNLLETYQLPEPGQTVLYSIEHDPTGGAFAVNAVTGEITVVNPALLDYEAYPPNTSLPLLIRTSDEANPSAFVVTDTGFMIRNANEAPAIPDQTFAVDENAAPGTVVGQLLVNDPDAGETFTYSLNFPYGDNTFAIDAGTGVITVLDNTLLNYETLNSLIVNVSVTDAGGLGVTRQFEIAIRNVNEAPWTENREYTVPENAYSEDAFGYVPAYDPESAQGVQFAIIGSTLPGAFSIHPYYGTLTIADGSLLDHETLGAVTLTVTVSDFGEPSLSSTSTITIHIGDVNEQPTAPDQELTVAENTANGTVVGAVQASDPDDGQTLTYVLNDSSFGAAFSVNPTTGAITVIDGSLLNYEHNPLGVLTVTIYDSGDPTMAAFARVFITLTDVNDAPQAFPSEYAVNENTGNGTFVGAAIAWDFDHAQSLSYQILSSTLPGAFAFDPGTAQIFVADSSLLDFENVPSVTLTVLVSDDGSPSLSTTTTVTFHLIDVNEAPTASSGTFSTPENSAGGVSIGTVTASDPDAGQSLTYSIDSTSLPGAFAINPSTGEITVADGSLLNFETVSNATLSIRVTDNGDPALSTASLVTISITDVDESPVASDGAFSVPEYIGSGHVVGVVQASPGQAGQTLLYEILGSTLPDAFQIHPFNGEIRVLNTQYLDHETVPTATLTVRVSDYANPSLSSTATITISVTDVNESPDLRDQTFAVPENSANGTVVGTVVASDPDHGQTLTYSIVSQHVPGAFAINPVTGLITVANGSLLNFESRTSIEIGVWVDDDGTPVLSSVAPITIQILDVNEAPTASNGSFTVQENRPNGTVIGTVSASDPDAGQTLQYQIIGSTLPGAFTINPATGEITVANGSLLNYESATSATLTVQITDSGTPALSTTAVITVSITNANEAPNFPAQTFSIAENSSSGTVVGTLSATDPDGAGSLTYQLVSSSVSGAFTINASTGRITVASSSALNHETRTSIELQVRVTDSGNPALSTTAPVTILITDVNEAAPNISDRTLTIAENTANGVVIGTITGTDADTRQNLTYSIASSTRPGAFTINPVTGQITVADATLLNYESTTRITLTVSVTDSGTPSRSDTATVTINLTNVNEAPVVNAQTFTIAENTANGTTVGTVAASDPDSGQSRTFSIASGNTSSAFAINSSTGRITVNNKAALDYEVRTSFSLVVRVRDNGNPNLSTDAVITINLTNVNEPVAVSIDVKPGDSTNTFRRNEKFDLAILSSATFDARQVNVNSIRFGRNGNENSLALSGGSPIYSYRDVNGDGRLDLVVRIDAALTGFATGSSTATFTAELIDGQSIISTSPVMVRK
jgi:predicted outer membrane repeat protein